MLFSAALASVVALPLAAAAQTAPPAGPVPAQGQHRRHHGAGFMRAMRGINLSDQQKAQLRQTMQQYRQAHPAGSPPDPQARKQLRQQVMNVLTPAQRQQFQQNVQQMRAQRKQWRSQQQPSGAFPPDVTPSPVP